MYYLLMRDQTDRDAFIDHMRAHQIVTPFHYVPLHSAPAGQRLARSHGELPVTDAISARLVRLPMFYDLPDQIGAVIEIALEYLSRP